MVPYLLSHLARQAMVNGFAAGPVGVVAEFDAGVFGLAETGHSGPTFGAVVVEAG